MPTNFSTPVPGRSPLGQETGGDDERHRQEASKLLSLLSEVDMEVCFRRNLMGTWEVGFLGSMRGKLVKKQGFSGKEVMKLRDLKDKLLEKGVI
jgi:hypothetical protein